MTSNWLKQIPDMDLEKLLDGLSCYMLFQGELYGRMHDEKWRRHGKPLAEWPIVEASDLTRKAVFPSMELTTFCEKAASPDDLNHRPSRYIAEWRRPSEPDHPDNARTTRYECSCGVRDGDARSSHEIAKFWRVVGTRIQWPTEVRNGIAHHLFCPYADTPDNPRHAPLWYAEWWDKNAPPIFVQCACRRLFALREFERDGRDIKIAKALPLT